LRLQRIVAAGSAFHAQFLRGLRAAASGAAGTNERAPQEACGARVFVCLARFSD
jgi:hypothetical protein